ncbi:MAG TPA: AAA family ATPase [Rhizomicrobium sp.]|jgi:thymidylate kinase|nr:AAA family ATPase [Rhizomicrobium sp.]
MGIRNYLIEGVSGTGKTSVCRELQRRGCHAVNGDTALAYQGDPKTGKPVAGLAHAHHIWNVDKVRALAADHSHAASFFCGGSRNFASFLDVFDRVFVLEVDSDTLTRRLAARPETEWGGRPAERQLIVRLHATKEDVPKGGVAIDATAPIERVVDAILEMCS